MSGRGGTVVAQLNNFGWLLAFVCGVVILGSLGLGAYTDYKIVTENARILKDVEQIHAGSPPDATPDDQWVLVLGLFGGDDVGEGAAPSSLSIGKIYFKTKERCDHAASYLGHLRSKSFAYDGFCFRR